MTIEELRKLLSTDIVTVVFTKKDGTSRKMLCTTISSYLPELSSFDTKREPPKNLVTVWDLEQKDWRSFRFDSVKSVDTEYFNYVVGNE